MAQRTKSGPGPVTDLLNHEPSPDLAADYLRPQGGMITQTCGGSRHMPPAPSSDFLGDDRWAEQFYEVARRHAVAELPHGSWTPAPVTQRTQRGR